MASTKLPIGLTKRVPDAATQAAFDDLKRGLEADRNYGTEPPDANTPGRIYFQIQTDSYTRTWIKDSGGSWR
jgi:hypothetical protein